MSTPLPISVVIPACDRPEYLQVAVDSVLTQSSQPEEIIIVDNGRQPADRSMLPEDERIKLIRAMPRFGVSQARNFGVMLSDSKYLAFLDDDDSWDSHYLESVWQTIGTTDADIVLGRLRSMEDGQPMKNKQAEFANRDELVYEILRRNPGVVGSNTTVSKAAFFITAGYDPWLTVGQDKALVLEMLLSGCSVARADNAWVNFREHFISERQTEIRKRAEGAFRFIRKYWRLMNAQTRLFTLAQLAKLVLKKLFGKRY